MSHVLLLPLRSMLPLSLTLIVGACSSGAELANEPDAATNSQASHTPMPETSTPDTSTDTSPKNLRIDLVSNRWAQFSWAPSNDDGEVVAYRILRSDGHVYTIQKDPVITDAGAQAELDKYWATTSFVDCNFTRFYSRVFNCFKNQPNPGETYTYYVSAIDNEGMESVQSDSLTITYHAAQGAAVPEINDNLLDDSGFAQTYDLSQTENFIDEFQVVFEDEFEGSTIDKARWNTSMLWGSDTIINSEQQYYVDNHIDPDFGYNPFKLSNSVLTIEAIPTPNELKHKLPAACDALPNPDKPRCQLLSGALSTHDKFNMTFGYVESRMKTSATYGALATFYLYHRYPGEGLEHHAPEIDIVEYLGKSQWGDGDAFQTYHYADVNTRITRSSPTMLHRQTDHSLYSDDFHTYGVLWEPQLIIWYIDGQEIKRISGPQVGRRAMNIVANLVTGSEWAPTPDLENGPPLQLEIDYIRAYQRDVYNGNGLYPP